MRVPGGLSGFCIFTIRRVAVAKRPNKSCQATTGADATSTCKVLREMRLPARCVSRSLE